VLSYSLFSSAYCFFCVQNLSTAVRPRSQPPIYAIRLPGSCLSSASSVSSSSTNIRSSGSVYVVTKPSTNGLSPVSVSRSSMYGGSSHTSTIPAPLQSSPAPILATAKVVLMVEVTNVWFGAARCKPCQPVVISEQGIKLVFKDTDNSRWIQYVFLSYYYFLYITYLTVIFLFPGMN